MKINFVGKEWERGTGDGKVSVCGEGCVCSSGICKMGFLMGVIYDGWMRYNMWIYPLGAFRNRIH